MMHVKWLSSKAHSRVFSLPRLSRGPVINVPQLHYPLLRKAQVMILTP